MSEAKDRIRSEKQKIREIPGTKKKIQYIWEYYKLWIIGIVALVLFTGFSVNRYFFHAKDYWFYLLLNNTYADVGTGSDFYDGYTEYAGYDLGEKEIVFNNTSYFDYGDSVTGNTYFESFVAYTETGTLDAITMECDDLVELGESGRLLDLDSQECSEIREKYGDRYLYCRVTDEDGSEEMVAVGIDVSDSALMEDYQVYSESAAVGIGAGSQHLDAVLEFLDYLYEEDM